MTKKPNIVLIGIDSLRADHLGCLGYHKKNNTPNIDRLAEESNIFKKAFSVGPGTPHAYPSILTSTYPLDYKGPRKIEKPRVMISEVLRNQGYITAVFHSTPYLSNFFGYNQGWDFFEDVFPYESKAVYNPMNENKNWIYFLRVFLVRLVAKLTFNISPHLFFGLRYFKSKLQSSNVIKPRVKVKAEFVNNLLKDFISSVKDKEKPFFLLVHYMDVHSYLPYDCHSQERVLSFKEWVERESIPAIAESGLSFNPVVKNFRKKYFERGLDVYDQGIQFTDQKAGELLDFLKENNLYENSIICLMADHGEEFLDHGGRYHTMDDNRLYNELLWVPLIIKTPQGKGQIIDHKVSLIDLAPTLCNLVGVTPSPAFKGKDLFSHKREFVFHQNSLSDAKRNLAAEKERKLEKNQCAIACQNADWKYVIDYSRNKEELYNLVKDPSEHKNIVSEQLEALSLMRNKVEEFEKENPLLSLAK